MSDDTYSEQYRIECEARWVASLGSGNAIRAYLEAVREKRGQETMRLLRTLVWDILHPATFLR